MTSDTADRFTNLVDEARSEDAVEVAIEAFWAVMVEKYPEIKSGDFDPWMEHLMIQQASEWLEHWLDCNADRCEDCGKKILSVKDACFEMANMTCVSCFSKKQPV
jgi:hypothetical protein